MRYKTYLTLNKKLSLDLSQSILATMTTYVMIFGLFCLGLVFFDKLLMMYLYTFFYITLFCLTLKAESVEGKGELLLLKFVSYIPVNTAYLYGYSYVTRMWINSAVILEFAILFIILYFFNVSYLDILFFLLRIHILVITILYLRYLLLWTQKIKNLSMYVKLFLILLLALLPLIPYNHSLPVFSNITLYFDIALLVVFFLSLITYKKILDQLLCPGRDTTSRSVLAITSTISRIIFTPIKLTYRMFNIFRTYYLITLRSSIVVDKYVTVILIMLLFIFITSIFTPRTELQLINTMSFILCLNIFNRINSTHTIQEAIVPEYMPLSFRLKQMIQDTFSFINVIFIWILLILLLSIEHSFSLPNVFKGFILLTCYFLIISSVRLPTLHKWYSEEKEKTIKKQIRNRGILLVLVTVFISFLFQHLIIHAPIAFIPITVILCSTYYYLTYKRHIARHFS